MVMTNNPCAMKNPSTPAGGCGHRTPKLALALLLLTLIWSGAQAQPSTNQPTLSVSLSGTNLLVNYSLGNTQGWVTLFAADRLADLATQAAPVDLAPVAAAEPAQFLVPMVSNAPTRFFRVLWEPFPTRARALVFVDGPL